MANISDTNYKGMFCLLVEEKVGFAFCKSILHPLARRITLKSASDPYHSYVSPSLALPYSRGETALLNME